MIKARVLSAVGIAAVVGSFIAVPTAASPTVVPFFVTNILGAGPAFFVECMNTSDQPISSGADSWPLRRDALRIDGVPLIEMGGRMGPGMTMDVSPGGVWRGIIELRQTMGGSPAAVFGALVRVPFVVPIGGGRHTIAVRCMSTWSQDIAFFWEPRPNL